MLKRLVVTASLLFGFSQVALANACIDNDGDGWGWDGTGSCLIENAQSTVNPQSTAICTDSDGDGWGWDGTNTCQAGELPGNVDTGTTFRGFVYDVIDGDSMTIWVQGESATGPLRIRAVGIDTPEQDQPFGWEATLALSDRILLRYAEVHCFDIDPYGRNICKVLVDGEDVIEDLLRDGLAYYYTSYGHILTTSDRLTYQALQTQAQGDMVGVWSTPNSITPWDWRAQNRW